MEMEFLSILADMALESVTQLPSQPVDEKKMRVLSSLLLTIGMVSGVGLSGYFLVDSFRSGLLLAVYFWIGITVDLITAFSMGVILIKLWDWKSNVNVQENEEFLASDLRSVIALSILSLIPGLHILLAPLTVAKAKSLLDFVGHAPGMQPYRKVAGNLILIVTLLLMMYTVIIGLILIIAGDVRRVQ
ncbi:MAG: hypothetical protein ACOYYS_28130 [Chloroflexota bacterium]